MSIGLAIVVSSIIIAIVILYVNRRHDWNLKWNFKKLFSGVAIVFGISAILIIAAFWLLSHTNINVKISGFNPSDFVRSFEFKIPNFPPIKNP